VTGESQKCKMCNIKVKGGEEAMTSHRRTDSHQKLKKFLHPHCNFCNADFDHRSEWTYHRFTAEHLTSTVMAGRGADDGVVTVEEMRQVIQRLGGNKANKADKAAPKKEIKDGMIVLDERKITPLLKDVDLQNDEIEGSEFVKPVNGFFCQLCKNFFGPGKEVVKTHCAGKQHMENVKSGGKRKTDDRVSGSPQTKKTKK